MDFKLSSQYEPQGDQPEAIRSLVASIESRSVSAFGRNRFEQTFTMANVIQELQRPFDHISQ